MSNKQAKDELISILNQFNEPVKFTEIYKRLNQTYPERTVRRRISELCEQKIITKRFDRFD